MTDLFSILATASALAVLTGLMVNWFLYEPFVNPGSIRVSMSAKVPLRSLRTSKPISGSKPRVAIIGAGASGLTMAKLVQDSGLAEVTVFEQTTTIGGRANLSWSNRSQHSGASYVVSFGSKLLLRWMKAFGIERQFVKLQGLDGREMMSRINDAGGAPFALQASSYLQSRSRFMRSLENSPSDALLNQAAQPIEVWLEREGLHKIHRLLEEVLPRAGMGSPSTVSTYHAFKYADYDYFLSGVLRFNVVPEGGWVNFWSHVARGLDIRLEQQISKIERDRMGIRIHTRSGSFVYDRLVTTIPPSNFNNLVERTPNETTVGSAISWNKFTSSLVSVAKWISNADATTVYQNGATNAYGRVLYARFECADEDERSLYVVGQLDGEYTPDELSELAMLDIKELGGVDPRLVQQTEWLYSPAMSTEAIKSGAIEKIKTMQGEYGTYHTGASFSSDSIAGVTEFAKELFDSHVAPDLYEMIEKPREPRKLWQKFLDRLKHTSAAEVAEAKSGL